MSDTPGQRRPSGDADDVPRLGYLLKHAHLGYLRLTEAEFADLEITPFEWAALNCLNDGLGRSQREVAELLGIDRTTMVGLVDRLQHRGLVTREPRPEDRRKNIVVLTAEGLELLRRGETIIDACEQRYLHTLSAKDARGLKTALDKVIAAGD